MLVFLLLVGCFCGSFFVFLCFICKMRLVIIFIYRLFGDRVRDIYKVFGIVFRVFVVENRFRAG